MAREYTFVNEVLAGRAFPSEINSWIAKWHEIDIHDNLQTYLGFTNEEMSEWVNYGTVPDRLLAKTYPE